MAVTARRAKKKRAPQPVETSYEDDDEEEDEDDFVPGQDDDDDDLDEGFEAEDDDDEEDANVAGILEGHLYYEEKDDVLHYQGDTFHLSTALGGGVTNNSNSKKTAKAKTDDGDNGNNQLVWNPLRDPPPSSNIATYQMKGTISGPTSSEKDEDSDTKPSKLPERIFDITWTMKSDGAPLPGHHNKSCPGKTCGEDEEDEEEDGKQKASPKRPALFYNVVGREVVKKLENVLIQFEGGFYPPSSSSSSNKNKKAASKTTNSVPLNCQIQYVIPETRHSVAAAAAPLVAVAAAAASADEDDDEADEDMNYDELIALHEDANVDVEQLKRRYQSNNKNGNDDDGDGKPSAKKIKAAPKEEDDDDDVGF